MIIYPAIDLRGGKVVRLKKGDPALQTVFSEDPVETARQWIDQGADWIHMVNLDGAFSTANDNGSLLAAVARLDVAVQFGGGMRSLDDIGQALDRGASRVVVGTLAIREPEVVALAVKRWGAEAVCVALDARDGKVAVQGWQDVTDVTPAALGHSMVEIGVRHALFTDVSRDGGLSGANLASTIALGRETGLQVIASGGVSTVDEIEGLRDSGAVAGAVIGMALYTGRLSLAEAVAASGGKQ